MAGLDSYDVILDGNLKTITANREIDISDFIKIICKAFDIDRK